MFKKLSIIALIPLLALGFVGCSKNSSQPTGLTPGDDSDQTFLKAQATTDDFSEQYIESMNEALNYIYFSGSLLRPADTSFITYDDETSWWVVVVDRLDDSTFVPFYLVDSVRFSAGVNYQQYPDETTTTIDYRYWADFHPEAGQDTALDIYSHDECLLDGFTGDTIVVNGSTDYSVEGSIGNVEVEYSLTGEAEDVKYLRMLINDDGTHPIAGRLSLTVTIHTSGELGDFPATNATWSLVLTFDDEGYHARLESGQNYWEWSRPWDEVMRAGRNPDRITAGLN